MKKNIPTKDDPKWLTKNRGINLLKIFNQIQASSAEKSWTRFPFYTPYNVLWFDMKKKSSVKIRPPVLTHRGLVLKYLYMFILYKSIKPLSVLAC